MTEDNERDTSESDIELREVMEFGVDRVTQELEQFESDVPNHAGRLITDRSNDILQAITKFEMREARDSIDDPSEDQVKDTLEELTIDLLLALGSLDYEYELRIADAFERRMDFIEDFEKYEEALRDAETQGEAIKAFEKNMSEWAEDHPEMMPNQAPDLGGGGIEIGENVDDEDYDHDDSDKGFA